MDQIWGPSGGPSSGLPQVKADSRPSPLGAPESVPEMDPVFGAAPAKREHKKKTRTKDHLVIFERGHQGRSQHNIDGSNNSNLPATSAPDLTSRICIPTANLKAQLRMPHSSKSCPLFGRAARHTTESFSGSARARTSSLLRKHRVLCQDETPQGSWPTQWIFPSMHAHTSERILTCVIFQARTAADVLHQRGTSTTALGGHAPLIYFTLPYSTA